MNGSGLCRDCGMRLVECDICECCRACCDCENGDVETFSFITKALDAIDDIFTTEKERRPELVRRYRKRE